MLLARRPLAIYGNNGSPIPNLLVSSRPKPKGLGIIVPGYGYSVDGPLLRYPAFYLLSRGFDVFKISYSYLQRPDFTLDVLHAEVRVAVDAVLQEADYQPIVLIGKSLGTVAMAEILPRLPEGSVTAKAWISPNVEAIGSHHEGLRSQDSLVVIGSADRQYTPELASDLRAGGTDVAVIEGADHGIEDLTDMRASLRMVTEAYSAIEVFLDSMC